MVPVPYIALAILVLVKEIALWYYHRVMPPLLRFAMIVPGVALAMVYAVFQFGESYLPLEFRAFMLRDLLFVFFVWNLVFVWLTRGQHRKDVR